MSESANSDLGGADGRSSQTIVGGADERSSQTIVSETDGSSQTIVGGDNGRSSQTIVGGADGRRSPTMPGGTDGSNSQTIVDRANVRTSQPMGEAYERSSLDTSNPLQSCSPLSEACLCNTFITEQDFMVNMFTLCQALKLLHSYSVVCV